LVVLVFMSIIFGPSPF